MDILKFRDEKGHEAGYIVVSDPVVINGEAQPLAILWRQEGDCDDAYASCEGFVAGYKAAQPKREFTMVSSGGGDGPDVNWKPLPTM